MGLFRQANVAIVAVAFLDFWAEHLKGIKIAALPTSVHLHESNVCNLCAQRLCLLEARRSDYPITKRRRVHMEDALSNRPDIFLCPLTSDMTAVKKMRRMRVWIRTCFQLWKTAIDQRLISREAKRGFEMFLSQHKYNGSRAEAISWLIDEPVNRIWNYCDNNWIILSVIFKQKCSIFLFQLPNCEDLMIFFLSYRL